MFETPPYSRQQGIQIRQTQGHPFGGVCPQNSAVGKTRPDIRKAQMEATHPWTNAMAYLDIRKEGRLQLLKFIWQVCALQGYIACTLEALVAGHHLFSG